MQINLLENERFNYTAKSREFDSELFFKKLLVQNQALLLTRVRKVFRVTFRARK